MVRQRSAASISMWGNPVSSLPARPPSRQDPALEGGDAVNYSALAPGFKATRPASEPSPRARDASPGNQQPLMRLLGQAGPFRHEMEGESLPGRSKLPPKSSRAAKINERVACPITAHHRLKPRRRVRPTAATAPEQKITRPSERGSVISRLRGAPQEKRSPYPPPTWLARIELPTRLHTQRCNYDGA